MPPIFAGCDWKFRRTSKYVRLRLAGKRANLGFYMAEILLMAIAMPLDGILDFDFTDWAYDMRCIRAVRRCHQRIFAAQSYFCHMDINSYADNFKVISLIGLSSFSTDAAPTLLISPHFLD